MKLILNQCSHCKKTYNPKEFGTTQELCLNCNTKAKNEVKRQDNLKEALARNNKASAKVDTRLERTGDIYE